MGMIAVMLHERHSPTLLFVEESQSGEDDCCHRSGVNGYMGECERKRRRLGVNPPVEVNSICVHSLKGGPMLCERS